MRSLVFALSLLASIPFSVLAQDEPVGVRAEARILRPGVMPLRAIQGDMVLEIEGIPQPIEVLSWSWGVSQTGSGRAGAGGGAGRAQFKDLTVTKKLDAASPQLFVDTASGRHIARATLRKIRENLGFAFVYNIAAIPLAAFGFLTPVIAGAAMALSSVSVVTNALLLRRLGRAKRRA